MSAFSWRCQYCSWAFQLSSDAVAAALAAADATQARHHVEHCPRCRKALKIPVDQLRHHAPLSAPAASPAPIRSLSFKEDKKPMTDIPAPFPPVEPAAPAPAPVELPAPAAPVAPKPVVKKVVKKAKKVAKKPVKKTVKKTVKKAKKVAKKAVKKTAKKKSRK
jgi:outer membrane biosynthesis protein TonB